MVDFWISCVGWRWCLFSRIASSCALLLANRMNFTVTWVFHQKVALRGHTRATIILGHPLLYKVMQMQLIWNYLQVGTERNDF